MTTPPSGTPWEPPPGYGPPTGYGPPPGPDFGSPPGQGYGPPQGEDTTWAVLAHLSAYVFPFIGPLAIYLIKREESPFTRHHAAEALNFHICLTLYAFVAFVLVFVLIGFLLLPAVIVFGFVMPILGALAASRRTAYRYPLTIHFLS